MLFYFYFYYFLFEHLVKRAPKCIGHNTTEREREKKQKRCLLFCYHKLSGWLEQASGLAYIKSRGRVKGQLLFPRNARDEQTAVLDAVEEESHVGHAQAAVQHTKGESSPLFGEIGHQELGQHLQNTN